MKILLTNDDGIEAAGITALYEALSPKHEVWLVAPDGQRSGSAHAITFRDSIRLRPMGERRFACRGTLVDCVSVSLLGIVPKGIEMVVSGINHGANLGTDLLYSGTAAAARQAVLMGVPAVALSIGSYVPPFDFSTATAFLLRNLELIRSLSDSDHFPNINFPNGPAAGEPAITFPSRRIYSDELHTYTAFTKDVFCFIGGAFPASLMEEGSDCKALSEGRISISPIHVHPANCDPMEARYRSARFL